MYRYSAHVYTGMGGKVSPQQSFFRCYLFFLRQGLSLAGSSLNRVDSLASKPRDLSVSASPKLELQMYAPILPLEVEGAVILSS